MTRKNIAVIGECMIELSQKGDALHRGFGGDTLNTSVYISRQVSPDALNVHYVTALGTDGPMVDYSDDMFEQIKACVLMQHQRHLDPTRMPIERAVEMSSVPRIIARASLKTVSS